MKKFISILLTVAMLILSLGIAQTTAFAVTDELLENGDFEEGDDTGFFLYGVKSEFEVDTQYAHSGDYGMLISDRQDQYATRAQDITSDITECGPGDYKASVWVRHDEGATGDTSYLVINYRTKDSDKDNYIVSEKKEITDKWQQFVIEKPIEFDQEVGLAHVYIYVQSFNSEKEGGDICIDDMSLVKVSEVNGQEVDKVENVDEIDMKAIDVTKAVRSETTSVGAIRWDAWYGHNDTDERVLVQVEKTLSPAKYHFRAPFFAKVTEEGNIEIPEYTQEIFDKEMEYAIDAGIDYFAYVWYNNAMSAARKFHTTSKYKEKVKLCACFDSNAIGKEYARAEMAKLLKEDYYMTVLDGRPLMYYYATSETLASIADDIKYYRGLAEKIGVPEPYAVVMNVSAKDVLSIYGDAASQYSVSLSDGKSYKDLTAKAKGYWSTWRASAIQNVPIVTMGWHVETRVENPVSWMTTPTGNYAQYATDEEIQEHTAEALEYMKTENASKLTKANTVIIYAWNEHDEGGWICPTIAVDENGNQLFNDDGTPQINDGHLQAVKAAIMKTENTQSVVQTSTVSPTAVTATDEPTTGDETDSKFPWLWVVCGAGAMIVAAGIAAVIVIKKKKKDEQ